MQQPGHDEQDDALSVPRPRHDSAAHHFFVFFLRFACHFAERNTPRAARLRVG
jgi:hypothetical protein